MKTLEIIRNFHLFTPCCMHFRVVVLPALPCLSPPFPPMPHCPSLACQSFLCLHQPPFLAFYLFFHLYRLLSLLSSSTLPACLPPLPPLPLPAICTLSVAILTLRLATPCHPLPGAPPPHATIVASHLQWLPSLAPALRIAEAGRVWVIGRHGSVGRWGRI